MSRKTREGIIGSIDDVPLKGHYGVDRKSWLNVIMYEPVKNEK